MTQKSIFDGNLRGCITVRRNNTGKIKSNGVIVECFRSIAETKKRKVVAVTETTNLNLKPNTIKISLAKIAGLYVTKHIFAVKKALSLC